MQRQFQQKLTQTTLALALSALAAPALANDHGMHAEMQALKDRLQQLEAQMQARQAEAARPATTTVNNTTFQFGGYIKVDAISSRFSDGELAPASVGRDIHLPHLIPVAAGGDASQVFDMHAKTTRFFMKTNTTTANGKNLGGHIEFDFLVGNTGNERVTNRYDPTLRHAYLTYDKFLVGQFWTNFQDLGAFPDTVEFVGATNGTTFGRQPQIRYTSGNFIVSVENPESFIQAPTPGGAADTDDNTVPDVVARYTHRGSFGHVSAAGIVRQLKSRGNVGTASAPNDSTVGGGLSVSGLVKVGSRDDIRFMVTHGQGIGRYVAFGVVNDANFDANGDLEANELTAGYVTYRHVWNDKFRSNFQLAGIVGDYNGNAVATNNKHSTSALTNIIYAVTPKLDVGLEYLRSERTQVDDLSGRLDRVQAHARYSF